MTNFSFAPSGGLIPMPPTSYGLLLRPYGLAAFCQLVVAVILWLRLYHRLRQRAFRLEESRL